MDIVCYSHLRWNFVYQRPQHIMSRLSKYFRVFFFEEPVFGGETVHMEITEPEKSVWVLVPHLPPGLSHDEKDDKLFHLYSDIFLQFNIRENIAWFYTPMALFLSKNFKSSLIIYDCMDELSAFKFAPPEIKLLENQLLTLADIVFTGGYSLYEAKKHSHHNIHLFPSSIDKKHFERARYFLATTPDQNTIPSPRIGFFGVVDERMDIELLFKIADKKPEWHFVIVGPVVKIAPDSLPKLPNIHFLGQKNYNELPDYISGWDVAMMPFAINESTRFISPTKTPEYLAAGKPVVSTAIHDVVKTYGDAGLVYIAENADEFISSIQNALHLDKKPWLKAVDIALTGNSWDITCEKMMYQINLALGAKKTSTQFQNSK